VKRSLWTLSFAAALVTFAAWAQDPPPAAPAAPAAPAEGAAQPAAPADTELTQEEIDKLSYAIGAEMGNSVKMQIEMGGVDLNMDVLLNAIRETAVGGEPKMSQDELQAFFVGIQSKLKALQQKKAGERKQEQQAFLEENAKKEGIKKTATGLQYKVIKEGTGAQPKPTDTVQVNYEGRLIDGKVFDSSERAGKPLTIAANQVIPGWTEALGLMKEGAKWQLYIPSSLAYRDRPPRGSIIPPDSTLVFDVELLKVMPSQGGAPTVNIPQQPPARPAQPKKAP
jgi:FKBP-type peptidyl-prolyl cis-trans isomerase